MGGHPGEDYALGNGGDVPPYSPSSSLSRVYRPPQQGRGLVVRPCREQGGALVDDGIAVLLLAEKRWPQRQLPGAPMAPPNLVNR